MHTFMQCTLSKIYKYSNPLASIFDIINIYLRIQSYVPVPNCIFKLYPSHLKIKCKTNPYNNLYKLSILKPILSFCIQLYNDDLRTAQHLIIGTVWTGSLQSPAAYHAIWKTSQIFRYKDDMFWLLCKNNSEHDKTGEAQGFHPKL